MSNFAELISPPFPPDIAIDRTPQGDHYDIKIDDLRKKLRTILLQLDETIPAFSSEEPVIGQILRWNGDYWEPSYEGDTQDSGLNLWPNPVEGEIGYLISNNTLAKAIAVGETTSKIYGVYNSSGSISFIGIVKILLEPGLDLNPNDTIFLSDSMEGRGTNIVPSSPGSVIKVLGYLRDTTGYDNILGSAQYVLWRPETSILIP